MNGQPIVHLNEFIFQRSQFYYQIAEEIDLALHAYRIQYAIAGNEIDLELREIARKCAKDSYQSGIDRIGEIDMSIVTKICIFLYRGIEKYGDDIFWYLSNYEAETREEKIEKHIMEYIFQKGDDDKFEVGVYGTDDTKVIVIAFIS